MTEKPSQAKITAALLATQLLFGINYSVAKIVVAQVSPIVWAAVRALLTAVLLGCLVVRRPHAARSKKFFRTVLFFSAIGIAFNQGCFLIGLKYTTSTNSAILNTLIPVFAVIFVTLLGKEKLTGPKAIGFLCAFLGALTILHVEKLELSNKTAFGDLLMVVNSMSFGLYLALSKTFLETNDRVRVTFWMFLFGGSLLALVALPTLPSAQMPEFSPELVAAMAFVLLGGSFFPYIFNNWALAHTDASRVALYVYLQPVIASITATILLHETPTGRTAVGSLLIFSGAYLATAGLPSWATFTRLKKG